MRARPPLYRSAVKAAFLGAFSATAFASSHREAPFVTEHPKVDGTDFYLFTSYERGRSDFVTLVANYQPLQAPYGGPNYYFMDPDASYAIHIDNDGDALEDITFRFRFDNNLRDIALPIGPPGEQKTVSVPLLAVGPIVAGNDAALNLVENYELAIECNGCSAPAVDADTGSTSFTKPLDNVGTKTLPDYDAYARQFLYEIVLPDGSRGRLFVGQRKDPFVVNLGEAFDLIHLDPVGDPRGESDALATANVTSFILEIPRPFLVGEGNGVLGGWTTASQRRHRRLLGDPTFDEPALERGREVQLSRLGMPLVNELVIGLKDKDRFNASHPSGDGQFLDYVTNPTLPALIEVLFGDAGVTAPTLFPRTDLIQVFLTGVPGLNETATAAEYLRLNTLIPPTPAGMQHNLGVLGGDLAGFPNGRRPGDDVVDAALRVVMGVLLDPSVAPSGQLPFTDGASVDDSFFDAAFPYLRTPLPGAPQP